MMATICGMNAYLIPRKLIIRFLRKKSAPLYCVNYGNSKSGNDANQKRGHNTTHSDCQAPTVDGRKHLTGDNATNCSPADLHD